MPSYNKVIIAGHLTRDPETRYTPNGKAVTQISLALNRSYKTESGEAREEVAFVDVTFWGKTAENVAQYMKKGSALLVEGRLKTDEWQDKQTGAKRTRLVVTGELAQFLGGKGGSDKAEPQRQAEPKPAPAKASQMVEEDDVPF